VTSGSTAPPQKLLELSPYTTDNPFNDPIALSPLHSVPKKDSSERRVIVDLSFPEGESVNLGILKDEYLGLKIKFLIQQLMI
jgi:hypothetical protein